MTDRKNVFLLVLWILVLVGGLVYIFMNPNAAVNAAKDFNVQPLFITTRIAVPVIYFSVAGLIGFGFLHWCGKPVGRSIRLLCGIIAVGLMLAYLLLLIPGWFSADDYGLLFGISSHPALFAIPGFLLAIGLTNNDKMQQV